MGIWTYTHEHIHSLAFFSGLRLNKIRNSDPSDAKIEALALVLGRPGPPFLPTFARARKKDATKPKMKAAPREQTPAPPIPAVEVDRASLGQELIDPAHYYPTDDAVVSDSILSHPDWKLDEMWLQIKGFVDVQRGRRFAKHDWKLPRPFKRAFIMCSGNDFSKAGPRVKGSLPHDFDQTFKEKLLAICASSQETTFVLWGDWDTWKSGFKNDQTDEDGARYNEYGTQLVKIASSVCNKVIWVKGDLINELPKTTDAWHFLADAKTPLQALLKKMDVVVEETAPEDSTSFHPAKRLKACHAETHGPDAVSVTVPPRPYTYLI